MAPRDPELRRRSGGRDRSRSSGPGAFPALPMGSEVWMVPRDPELHRGTGGKERSHSSGPGEGPSLLRGWAHPFDHRKGPDLWGPWCSLVHTRKDQNTRGQQYLPQEGWTREESSRREVRGSPVQGRGTSRTVNWKFIPYSVRDHVYFRGNTCVLGAPPSCGPAPGSEVWMVPRDPELHRVTGGKERSHSSGPGEGPSLLRGWAHPFDHRKGPDLWSSWCSLAHTQKDQNTMGQQYLTQEEVAEFKIRGPGFWSPGGGKGDPYFFCWLVPHGVTGGWCPEILSSTKGQVGETEVAAQDVEQFQHFQEGQQYLTQEEGAEFKIRGPGFWSPGGGKGDPYFFCWLVPHGVMGGWCPEILSSTEGQVGRTEVAAQDLEQLQHCQARTLGSFAGFSFTK
ncbi:uncharacterized protein LOC111752811 isoform X4 [Loxodonta africana]|uniref:uncharacterized protein LOC111752811 isoform X4 n=1 Tax=Loxodonta africana TaxID=9785 RepID=UPI0030CBEAF9